MTTTQEPGTLEKKEDRRINPVVFYGSAAIILGISVWAIITPSGAERAIGVVVGWIAHGMGWYYFLAATVFLVFVIFIAMSRYGKVKLGPQHSKPAFSLFAWASMLFAAGIGIDLMFFSVSGPVTHYLAPPEGAAQTVEAARQAVVWTLFHYGVSGWAMYALMGMVLGYFAYRHRLPLSIRSALYPIIGKRVHGRAGDAADIAAVVGTIFGIAVSLGIGVVQLNYGLHVLFGLPEGVGAQIGLITLAAVIAIASALSGVDKGIRLLSELNVVLAGLLMLYIMVLDDPIRLLNGLILNVGDYVSRLPAMTLNTFAYDQPTEWLNAWTLFFWAWWVTWAPFVGLFLARISRGRTIRQFVAATLIIPFLFTLAFLSIFANAALGIVRGGNAEFGQIAMNQPERGLFALLAEYPGVTFSTGLATFVGLLFYVTSADSGALVMGNFTSRLRNPTSDPAPWLRVFWALATGLLTMAMLLVGGIGALTNATIIMGLPFSFVMFLLMWGFYRALRGEPLTWRHRVARVLSYPDRQAAIRFVTEVARPAFTEVAEELTERGADTTVDEDVIDEVPSLTLTVAMGAEEAFTYRVVPRERQTPSFAPRSTQDTYYRIECGDGNDVLGYSTDQLIGDLLDKYEQHLERLHGEITGDPPGTHSGRTDHAHPH